MSTMLQPPLMLNHQQLYQHPPSSSFIDSHSSLHHQHQHQQHQQQHHQQNISPSSTRHCGPASPLQSPGVVGRGTSSEMMGRGSSSDIETGVWTCTDIPAGVTFGPYEGEFMLGHAMKDHRATPYMLEVKYVDGRLISGPDAHPTRWMRFVSPSRKDHEHNLEADIAPATSTTLSNCNTERSVIVFRTTRAIMKGEELLVWYSSRLADKEGVPLSVNRFKGKDVFSCGRCCSNFKYPNTLKAHMRFRCYAQDSRYPGNTISHQHPHPPHHHHPHLGITQDASVSTSNGGSAFHRVTASSISPPTGHLYVASSNHCHSVRDCSPRSSHRMDGGGVVDHHSRRRDSSSSGSNLSPPVNGTLTKPLGLGKIGSSGSAFRPTGKALTPKKPTEEKEGFRVIESDSSKPATTMGTSIGTPVSPHHLHAASKRSASESEMDSKRAKVSPVPGGSFSMDKVLSMPRVGHPQAPPGAALAYLEVQKALAKNYGMPTYDPVAHASEIPAAIRALHRAPLGLDPFPGYPYRFLPPPGFPIPRLPHMLPVHRPGEAFNGLAKFPYPGLLKFPPTSEPNTAAPSALLTPPPEMDMAKYAALERNLTTQTVTRPFPVGDPQYGYQNGKNKRGHLCIYCGKLYSRKYGLKIHLRTHTGYKPLKCKVCLRPFGDPSNLNKHIRLHAEGDTPYRCDYCGKVLVRRRDLDRHIRSRHPNECNKLQQQKSEEATSSGLETSSSVKDFEASSSMQDSIVQERAESEDLPISVDDDDDDDDVDVEVDCENDDDDLIREGEDLDRID